MYPKSLASLLVFTAALIQVACSKAPHAVTEKYYLLVPNAKSPYWEQVSQGLYRAARELKVTASMEGPDTYDPKAQKAVFQRIVSRKPSGILVSASDPKILNDDINAAVNGGIPVITVDSDAPESLRLCFVGTNNYEAGLLGGRTAAKQLGGKGNVVIFTTVGQPNLEERLSGYRKAFESHPQIKIVGVVDIRGDARIAFDRMVEIFEKDKFGVDGFISLEGQSPREIADILGRKKVTAKAFIGMDALPSTLDAIEKGVMDATIAQRPFTMGYAGLRMLADLHLHKVAMGRRLDNDPLAPVPKSLDTGLTLIDRTTLASYRRATEQASQEAKKTD